MTTITGAVTDIGLSPFDGHVLIRALALRPALSGAQTIVTAPHRVQVRGGKLAATDISPGRAHIVFESAHGFTDAIEVDIPDRDSIDLHALLDFELNWTPAVIERAEAAIAGLEESTAGVQRLIDSADDTSKRVTAEISKAGADAAKAVHDAETSAVGNVRDVGDRAVSDAKASADAASKSATAAAVSASGAKGSASSAATSATAAASSATAAKSSADASAASATAAASSAKAAASSASSAKTSADVVASADSKIVELRALNSGLSDVAAGVRADADRAEHAADNAESATELAVNRLKGDAPAAFDTLGEIAAELARGESARAALTAAISAKADRKDLAGLADRADVAEALSVAKAAQTALGAANEVIAALKQQLAAEQARPATFVGSGTPSSIPNARVGDTYFDAEAKIFYRIDEV